MPAYGLDGTTTSVEPIAGWYASWIAGRCLRVVTPDGGRLYQLPRIHLFELEDQRWFPQGVRELATEFLRFGQRRPLLHRCAKALLADAIRRTGTSRVVDLCSGGGGPVPALAAALGADGRSLTFVLTDRYPYSAGSPSKGLSDCAVSWHHRPVDAREVPRDLPGLRTLFDALHHFRPADAVVVLSDAARARQPIAVFELADRRLLSIAAFALLTPLAVLLLTPWIRPFRWQRLVWTYLIPLVPLTCWWDGVVSQLRAYTPSELAALTAQVPATDYWWVIDQTPRLWPGLRLTYLLGFPGHIERDVPVPSQPVE